MNALQLRRLAIGVAVLVAVWGGLSWWRRADRDVRIRQRLTPVNADSVDSIVLSRAADTVHLTRQGDRWLVNGFPAGAGVADLLKALADTAAEGDLIARSPASHEQLGLDSAHAVLLTVSGGGAAPVRYLFGHRDPSYQGIYLREPGKPEAYFFGGRLGELAERGVDDWRDKVILALEPDSVTGIEVERGRRSYRLTRSGAAWSFGPGGPADPAAVTGLLTEFRTLNATGFATAAQADSADFARPERRVRLYGPGGRSLGDLAFDSTAAAFWVRLDSTPTVYRLESWLVNQLTPADSTLRKK